ncbi:SMC-Scp complex subunit ScpB [Acidiferrobacter sp.]|uniref:SMC-Scp complex subunit ScpB n=1 Tax=Acidiferrobacter sp. TaxID=1872107 RepID=UPI00261F9826|nr:SMC-Scp complex subunit ScpB [Acidiferrobacter sp.]
MSDIHIRDIVQAALLVAGEPLTLERLGSLFEDAARPTREELLGALEDIGRACGDGPLELQRIEAAYRLQTRAEYAPWLNRLFAERPGRYSRAVLETLAIIAYRQPTTRGEIEAIRGVAVSSDIIKTLISREWIRQVGTKDVPGRPALYGTTRAFLENFNLTSLGELPPLSEVRMTNEEQGDHALIAVRQANGETSESEASESEASESETSESETSESETSESETSESETSESEADGSEQAL